MAPLADIIRAKNGTDLTQLVPTSLQPTPSGAAHPANAVEEALLKLRQRVQTIIDNSSNWASQPFAQYQNSPSLLVRREYFYERLIQWAHAQALQNPTGGQATTQTVSTTLSPGPDSVWNRVWQYWDLVPGGSMGLQIAGSNVPADVEYFLNLSEIGTGGPQVQECEVCFALESVMEAQGLFLSLGNTRTQTLSIEPVGGPSPEFRAAPLDPKRPNSWHLCWRRRRFSPREVEQGLCFKLRFIGDLPFIRSTSWIVPPSDQAREEPADENNCSSRLPLPPATILGNELDRLERFHVDYASEIAERKRLIAADDRPESSHRRAQEFFLELDQTTNPNAGAAMVYAQVGSYLARRYLTRAQEYHLAGPGDAGAVIATSPAEAAAWKPEVMPVLIHLERLLCKHFPGTGPDAIDLAAVGHAFDCFGGGELTVYDTHGAPNGANIFCFAELAELAVQLGVQCDLWTRLFEIFCRSAEIFATSYHRCGALRTYCSYAIRNNPKGERAASQARKDALRLAWSNGLDLPRYTQLVHAALVDEVRIPGETRPGSTYGLVDTGCPLP